MTKVEIRKESPDASQSRPETGPGLAGMWRQLFLMSIGAVAMAQEEAEKVVKKLVDQGEMAEQDGKDAIENMLNRRKSMMRSRQARMEERMEQVLHKLNVPTKDDVKALEARIAELSAKIEGTSNSADRE